MKNFKFIEEISEISEDLKKNISKLSKYSTPFIPSVKNASVCKINKMIKLRKEISVHCEKCKLRDCESDPVLGFGNLDAKVVFVRGMATKKESKSGYPFFNDAGGLLNKMVKAMGFRKNDVYFCNLVKCAPINTEQGMDESLRCSFVLKKQIDIIRPSVLIGVGGYASNFMLNTNLPIGLIHGHWGHFWGIPVMPTFSPECLLRSFTKKNDAWDDLRAASRYLDEL